MCKADKRARNEAILRLDGVILTTRSLGLVTSAFTSQRPLSFELTTLFLKLPNCSKRNRELIRRQGIEKDALDKRVDWQSSDFLTQRSASLVPIGPAAIDRIYLPPYSPELNPKENLWDEIREKIFKNYALKSIDAVRAKLKQAILYIERNPKLVSSITSFPYVINSL